MFYILKQPSCLSSEFVLYYTFWIYLVKMAYGILELLIPNPDLDFWNSDLKIHFWANLGPKIQSCLFCLKLGTHGISRMLIFIPALVFWISNSNFLFGIIWVQNSKLSVLSKIGTHGISRMLILIPALVFWISNPNFLFKQIWAKKVKVVCFH